MTSMLRTALIASLLCALAACHRHAPTSVPTSAPGDPALSIAGDPESASGATWTLVGTLDGTTVDLQGLLLKPRGRGPFPAVVLSHAPAREGYCFAQQTFAEDLAVCQIRGGGHVLPVTTYTAESESTFRFHMDGPQLLRIAAKRLPSMTEELLASAGLAAGDVHVVPHQAAPKALAVVRRMLRFRAERFHNRVARMGNLIAASIPAVLHQCRVEGLLPRGEPVLRLACRLTSR
jgi:hypothetical protein